MGDEASRVKYAEASKLKGLKHMDYETIFRDIQEIMQTDYAGAKDKQHWPLQQPEPAALTQATDDQTFLNLVRRYLAQYRDDHVSFFNDQIARSTVGFSVRRYQAALYVTEVKQESRLAPGTAITAIDGVPIPQVVEQHQHELDPVPERQLFGGILQTAQVIALASGEILTLHHFRAAPTPGIFTYQQLQPDMGYVKMTNFADYTAIGQFYQQHGHQITALPKLVIDVRVNNGGDDNNFRPLLNAMYRGDVPHSASEPETNMQLNATPRNYQNWQKQFAPLLAKMDNANRQQIAKMTEFLQTHQQDGLTILDLPENDDTPETIHGTELPKKIAVLSDRYCGSAGDSFVLAAKKSPKATVIGRATYGVWDYANVVTQDFGHFYLYYPISRADWIDRGAGIDGVGVQPDIHLPWTPAMITEDRDLAFAEQFLNKQH